MAKFKRKGQALVLTPEQLKDIFRLLPEPHDAIAMLAYHTASRISEVLRLERSQFLPEGMLIVKSKTSKTGDDGKVVSHSSKTKTVNWTPELRAIAARFDGVQGHLFPSRSKRGYFSTQAFEKQLNPVLACLDIQGASTHSFRRSMATHLYKAGVGLEAIRRLTGHDSLKSLTLYIDVGREEAAEQISAALDSFWRTGSNGAEEE